MRRSIAMAAVLAGIGHSAAAQNVTIYGIVDLAVEHLSNVNAQKDTLTRMPNITATMPSRWGLRGTEPLGDGLTAFFNLESGFAADTGGLNNGGRAWGRAANVGLMGGWGRFTLGRQANMTILAISSHVMGPALYAVASHDPYIPNAINDNTIGYVGTFSGVTVGATWSLGRDTASVGGPAATNCPGESTPTKQCRQYTALLKYDTANYGVALSHDVQNGGPTAALGLNSADFTDKRSIANGWFRVAGMKFSGGVLQRERQTTTRLRSSLVYSGLSLPLSAALTLDAEWSKLDVKDSPNDSTLLAVRGTYALSKRSAVYAMVGQMRNGGTSAVALSPGATVGVGLDQSGVAMGLRHSF